MKSPRGTKRKKKMTKIQSATYRDEEGIEYKEDMIIIKNNIKINIFDDNSNVFTRFEIEDLEKFIKNARRYLARYKKLKF